MATSKTTHEKTRHARRAESASGEVTAKNLTPADRRFLEAHRDQLSKTTLRAKWLHSPDEHEDRTGQTLATRSHEVIQRWVEERHATPATVADARQGGRPRVLRFDFPGYGGRRLKQISWDEWFEPFDQRQLVFLFQEHKRDGQQSNFFRLDSPAREDA